MEWFGFIYSAGAWERVCDAHDLGSCHRKLNAICRERGVRGDREAAMTSGAPPSWTPGVEANAVYQRGLTRSDLEDF